MRILVTGTDGYIGSLLAPLLVERGHQVVGLDTGYYCDGWLNAGEPVSSTTIRKDIRSISAEDLQGLDAAVHLAELSNDPLGEQDPALTLRINHQGSVALALQCKRAGISRFVYTSSCSVYGAGADGLRNEDSETVPQTAYARCKVFVERDVMAMADERFSPTFLRNATAFGPSPRMRFDIVLNNLAGWAWTTKHIKMTSDGMPWRPLVHVLDICDAIACTLEAPREAVHSQVFNVGDTNFNYRVKDIAEIVAEAFPGCDISFGRSDGDTRSYRVSFDKIRMHLPEFACTRDARVGALQLHDLFSTIQLTPDMFEFRAYTRLKQLQFLKSTHKVDKDLFWHSLDDSTRTGMA